MTGSVPFCIVISWREEVALYRRAAVKLTFDLGDAQRGQRWSRITQIVHTVVHMPAEASLWQLHNVNMQRSYIPARQSIVYRAVVTGGP